MHSIGMMRTKSSADGSAHLPRGLPTPRTREPLNKFRLLSACHGLCGKTRFTGNVGNLAKKCNAVHKARGKRPSGDCGECADGVKSLGKVAYIPGEPCLVSPLATISELSKLIQRLPRPLVAIATRFC